jgi:hypothetical protein
VGASLINLSGCTWGVVTPTEEMDVSPPRCDFPTRLISLADCRDRGDAFRSASPPPEAGGLTAPRGA